VSEPSATSGLGHVLVICATPEFQIVRDLLSAQQGDAAATLHRAGTVAEALERLSVLACDAVVCAGQTLPEALSLLLDTAARRLPVIVVSSSEDRSSVVALFRAGAADVLLPSEVGRRLLPSLWRAAQERGSRRVAEDNEERFRDLVEHGGALLSTHTLSGRLLSINPAAARRLGYEPQEMVGRSIEELLWPAARTAFSEYLAEVTEHGTAQGVMAVRTRAGERRLWKYHTTLRADGAGSPLVRGLAFDVTDWRRLQHAVRTSDERYRMLFERNLAGICRQTLSGRLVDCNRAYAQLLGWGAPEELHGLDVSRFWLSTAEREAFERELKEKGSTGYHEIQLLRRDGSPLWVLVSATVLEEVVREEPLVESVLLDINERRAREDQKRESLRLEAVGQLAGGVAHDFNNLLTTILGYGELLLERAEEPSQRHGLSEILRAGERAAVVTRQLLAFGRRQLAAPRPLDLSALVRDTYEPLQRVLGPAIGLELRLSDGLDTVKADRQLMEGLLSNLAAAARSCMGKGGNLTIETSVLDQTVPLVRDGQQLPEGRYMRLSVKDTAPPLNAEARARAFEPFFRRGERLQSSGLELAAAYGIVHQSGGVIWLEAEGDGNRVEVRLPIVSGVPEVARPAVPQLPSRPIRILLVDDEVSVRRMAKTVLATAGYEVREAASGREAMGALDAEGPFDLLLTDVVMPGIDGATVAERLLARAPGLKVLLMTGYASALKSRFGVLSKPFTPDALRTRVAEALGRADSGTRPKALRQSR